MRSLVICIASLILAACSPVTAPGGEAIDAGDNEIDATVVCSQSSDCGGTTPVCDLANSICQPCSVNADCVGLAGGDVCSASGACVECASNAECTTPAAAFCGADETCRGCESNGECDSGACDFTSGICVNTVDLVYVGGTGTGDVGTCTKLMPCRTFAYATNQLSATRKTLVIAPQTFTTSLFLPSLPEIRVIGEGATIDGSTVPPATGDGLVELGYGAKVKIEGLTVKNAPRSGIICLGSTNGNDAAQITLEKVTIDGASESGLTNRNDCEATLREVTITGSGLSALTAALEWQGNRVDIDRSNFVANPGTAINVNGTRLLLQNSMITNNGSGNYNRTIRIAAGPDASTEPVTVRYNTIAFNSPGCVHTVEYSTTNQPVTFDSNIVYNNQVLCGGNIDYLTTTLPTNNIIENPQGGGELPDGNFSEEPKFLNSGSGDYSLAQDSVGIDMGTVSGAPSIDFRGNARPLGAGADIGAIESF